MPIDTSQQNMLFAAQMFGYAGNLYTQSRSNNSLSRATDLDKQAVDLQLKQQTLQATQESIASTDRLQEVLASQRAIQGARGGSQGNIRALTEKSLRTFGQEEASRALSSDYSALQAKSQKTLLDLKKYSTLGEQATANTTALFNNVSLNALFNGSEK